MRTKEQNRERMKLLYQANPEKYREKSRLWKLNNPEKKKAYNAKYRLKLKVEVLEQYGGVKCVCCGETEPRFLGIDHVDNDGKQERKVTGGGHAFYRWLKSNKYPKRNYKVMCQNCNSARYYYGQCPHKQMVLKEDPISYLSEFL